MSVHHLVKSVIEVLDMRHAATFEFQGSVMNIASGSCVTVHEVVALLEKISNNRVEVNFERNQYGDVRDTFADISRAQQRLPLGRARLYKKV